MAERVVVQADGSMPVRDRPACPCAQCAADWAAAPNARHGSMQRYESGCRCADCRMWVLRFNRALAGEADNENAQRFQPHSRDTFEPEVDPQPTQGGGGSNLLRRVLGRGR